MNVSSNVWPLLKKASILGLQTYDFFRKVNKKLGSFSSNFANQLNDTTRNKWNKKRCVFCQIPEKLGRGSLVTTGVSKSKLTISNYLSEKD